MSSDRIRPIEAYFFDANNLTGGYDLATNTPIEYPLIILRIINDSDTVVIVSYDGVTGHDCVPDGKTLHLQFQTNSGPSNFVTNLAKRTNIYFKGVAQSTGSIYIVGYYQE